jgi:hypothetical protein
VEAEFSPWQLGLNTDAVRKLIEIVGPRYEANKKVVRLGECTHRTATRCKCAPRAWHVVYIAISPSLPPPQQLLTAGRANHPVSREAASAEQNRMRVLRQVMTRVFACEWLRQAPRDRACPDKLWFVHLAGGPAAASLGSPRRQELSWTGL